MSKCIKCREKEATVPDRESGSRRKRLCSDCHSERLKDDLRYILHVESKRRKSTDES